MTLLHSLLTLDALNFGSLEFLFWCLPAFLAAYYLAPAAYRNAVLFAGSILLYALAQPHFVLVLLASCAVNFWLGARLSSKPYFTAAILLDVLLLASCKAAVLAGLCKALPVGVSFFTFKLISYQADVRRGVIPPESSFLRFAAYVSFFPQITSGPIMRYGDASKGLSSPGANAAAMEEGLRLLILGLASKILLADRIGLLWNQLSVIGYESISTPLAWLGAFAYSLQLYLDFAGYSLMAGGLGMLLGYPYIENFRHPYASRSVGEFWRRWHISLGSWFRDYVYFPLGGSRVGKGAAVRNLLAVWLLTGLWHGGTWNFLLWGLILGLLVTGEKFGYGQFLGRHKILSHVYLLTAVPLTWVVFAIPDLGQLGLYFTRLFPFFGTGSAVVDPGDFARYLAMYGILLAAGCLCCLPVLGSIYRRVRQRPLFLLLLLVLFWTCVYQIANASSNPFLYFQF